MERFFINNTKKVNIIPQKPVETGDKSTKGGVKSKEDYLESKEMLQTPSKAHCTVKPRAPRWPREDDQESVTSNS